MADTTLKTKQSARLEFRLQPEMKQKIEQAALASGQSLTDFAVGALLRSAEDVLERAERHKLSDRDRDRFLALLDNPPAPNTALQEAMRWYQRDYLER